ncbi:MAG: helix-turn-helix transcriptional regulator [Paeniclostridium sp.]|nr:helix-turn-helix transcriptional regulator [Paeniclostridium sp.]MBW4863333.1 helix-turn-helix transcriptional regulator [Paeniclostridium sp.]
MKLKVDEVLKMKKKSRYWLAKVTNIKYPNIKKICDGEVKSIKLKTLDKLCTALDVNLEAILEVEEHIKTIRRLEDNIKNDIGDEV